MKSNNNNLPKGWRKVKLGEIMQVSRDFGRKIKVSEYKIKGLIPIYDQGSDYISGYTDDLKAVYKGQLPAILFGDHTLRLRLINHRFAIGADGIQILEPLDYAIDRIFFYYLLKYTIKNLKSYGYERHLKYLRDLEISYPEDINEQKRIADILSAFDYKIELNNKIIKTLEEMAQEIFKEWFVRFRFPGWQKIKFVDSELGKIPEGWEVKNIMEIVKRIPVGKRYDNKNALPKGKVPILDQGQSGIIGFHNEEPGVKASPQNPVAVFSNHTCYYRLVTFDFSCIQNVIPYIGINGYPTTFVFYLTKDKIKMSDYKGHWPEFTSQKFIVPPPELAAKFNETIKPMIEKIDEIRKENQTLTALRDLLLPKLMSGEIRA
jgi:type I restriction enzyme S subunit